MNIENRDNKLTHNEIVSILVIVISVFFYLNFFDSNLSKSIFSSTTLILSLFFSFVFKKKWGVYLTIFFGTLFIFNISDLIIGDLVPYSIFEFYKYRISLISISYLLLGYAFSSEKNNFLSEILYSIGIFGFLFGIATLEKNIIWQIAYPILILITLTIGSYIRCCAFRTASIFFMLFYIMIMSSFYIYSHFGKAAFWIVFTLSSILFFTLEIFISKRFLSSEK